jgi:hypothetical protein
MQFGRAPVRFDRIGMARKMILEVVARCGETSPLNKRLTQGLRFRNQPTKSHQNGTLRGKNGVDDVEQQI